MEKKNFTYSGWKGNGFAALFLVLAGLAAGVALVVFGGVNRLDMPGAWQAAVIAAGCAAIAAVLVCLGGFMMLEPNEARVMTFFGKYKGTFYQTGYWWVNPFLGTKKISMRARNLDVEPIKVNDKTGNPIMIGLVLVWRIKREEVYKAVFDIDVSAAKDEVAVSAATRMNTLERFVRVQSDAALRQVAGFYAYDDHGASGDERTLRSNSDEINDLLEERLNERLEMAGIEVVEARINYLAYAPEIAAVMLRRQQADAIISAREKIVEGAVSMVRMALDRLSEEGVVELDGAGRAALVGNLLVVLCADEAAQPVVDAGTPHR